MAQHSVRLAADSSATSSPPHPHARPITAAKSTRIATSSADMAGLVTTLCHNPTGAVNLARRCNLDARCTPA